MPTDPNLGCHTFRYSPTDGGAWYFEIWRSSTGDYFWQPYHDEDCLDRPDSHKRGPFTTSQEAYDDALTYDTP